MTGRADIGREGSVDQLVRRVRRSATPLRLLLSAGLLLVIFWQLGGEVNPATLLGWVTPAALGWLAGAGLLLVVSYALSTLRWMQVTRALGLRARFESLLAHSLAGQFVSNALPTTIGGDVVRVARLSKNTGESPGSFSSVVLDRLTGWIVLPLLTLLGLVLNPSLRELGTQTRVVVGVALATLGLLMLMLYAADHRLLGGRFRSREGWQRFASAIHLGLGSLRRRPFAVLSVSAVGFVYQFTVVAWHRCRSDGADGVLPGCPDRPGHADFHCRARGQGIHVRVPAECRRRS